MSPQERTTVDQMRNALVVAKGIVKGLAGQAGIGQQDAIVQTLEAALDAEKRLPPEVVAQEAGDAVSLTDLTRRDQRIIQAALTELLARLCADPEPDLTIDVEHLLADLTRDDQFDVSALESLLDKIDALVDNPRQDQL